MPPAPTPTPEPAPTPPPTQAPAPTPTPASNSIYWGAWIGSQLTGTEAPWDMGAVSAFEGHAQKHLSLVHFAAPFADCSRNPCSYYGFPTTPMENIRKHGAIPFFSWSSQSTPSSLNEPNFQLSDLIGGAYDSYIRSFATAAQNWGHPFFLRFNWEMNGNWFSWSEGVNGNKTGEYVTAWRHVHDIFASVGATNVTWVWCPNVDPNREFRDYSSMYPGDNYVDWTSLDGYNWGKAPYRPAGWKTFDQLFSSTYHRIVDTIAPSKPMVIGEVGSTEYGGSKATWIQEMLAELPNAYPKVHGLVWFNREAEGEPMDWSIETSSSATSAFANGIQSPAYAGSQFASLSSGTIQPAG
ncbi:MAG TPA: glycosyl hydrolase [Solirubrobacterales bacterium]